MFRILMQETKKYNTPLEAPKGNWEGGGSRTLHFQMYFLKEKEKLGVAFFSRGYFS